MFTIGEIEFDIQVLIVVSILVIVLSVVLGFLLSFASKLLHVEEDARLQDIVDLLPNQNCGLCGNPGCRAMAIAILGEDAKLTQCKPGDQEMRESIKEYLETFPDETGEFVKVKM